MNAHNEQQPAAAQEAVVWQWRCPRSDTDWSDCDKSLYDELRKAIGGEAGEMNGLRYEVRALYAAAPVTAAPADAALAREEDAHMETIKQRDAAEEALGAMFCAVTGRDAEWSSAWGYANAIEEAEEHVAALVRTPAAPVAIFQERSTHSVYRGSCGSLPCYCWAESDHIIGDEVKRYSTPAAPVIDPHALGLLEVLGAKDFAEASNIVGNLLADASPKGELESWKRGTKACAEVLGQVTRQLQDSPKGDDVVGG